MLFLTEPLPPNNNRKMKKYVVLVLILFACEGKTPYSLGDNFYLDYDPNDYFAIHTINPKYKGVYGIVIQGNILKIGVDSDFIIAYIKPVYKIMKIVDPNNNVKLSDEEKLIAKSSIREYWIIDKKITQKLLKDEGSNNYYSTYSTFGPFNEAQYLKKLKELGVSDNLQLIPVMRFLEEE